MRIIMGVVLSAALVTLWACSAAASSPQQTVDAQSSDPQVNQEAQGQLILDMRTDDTAPFVYPCIWEEANMHGYVNKAGLIRYKTNALKPNAIEKVYVGVYDLAVAQNPWSPPEEGDGWVFQIMVQPPNANTNNTAKDSGFKTRTNTGKDAAGGKNYDADHNKFKFLDPSADGTKWYQARLIIKVAGGGRLQASCDFQARSRDVYWTNQAGSFTEAYAKCLAYKLSAKIAGDSDLPQDPNANERILLFTPSNTQLANAFDCVSPRGQIAWCAHGLPSDFSMSWPTPTTTYYGFAGPKSDEGTKGKANGPIYNLTNHAEMHSVSNTAWTCHSADAASGAISVIQSFTNSLEWTIGGGGSITGFGDMSGHWGWIELVYPDDENRPAILSTTTGLTNEEKAELDSYAQDKASAQMRDWGWFDQYDLVAQQWINDHIISNFNITGDQLPKADLTAWAKQQFDANHQNHAPYTYTVTQVNLDYVDTHVFADGGTTLPIHSSKD